MRIGRSVLLMLVPVAPLSGQVAEQRAVDLDHVILATPRLAWGMDEFARLTGVVPRRGGQHPGRGTENALVTLGSGHYLELLAPITPKADSTAPRLIPLGWALHTHDLGSVVARLRTSGFSVAGPLPGSRRTLDSTLLEWRTAAAAGPGLEGAPFFIEWAASTLHPSTTSPEGCRLVTLQLSAPDTTRLHDFFRAVDYPVVLRPASPGGLHLTLDCPRGRVVFAP